MTSNPVPTAIGLVPHRDRPVAHGLAQSTAAWFSARGVEVRIPSPEADASDLAQYARPVDDFARGLDFVVSLGGDGTMLHTVQLVYPEGVPVLGVNVGQLAYLSALEIAELEGALPRLLEGDYTVTERMMLDVRITAAGEIRTKFALNEAVLEKERAGHLIRFDLSINGTPFTSYAADGVIIATPTGSTAYSFSAHGPIGSPALRCVLLTPISPHMLFDRSLILAEDEELEFVISEGRRAVCTIDGRDEGVLNAGDRVTCQAAKEPLRMVELRPRDFHQILKAKFALPDR
ncbi:MAG: NAD(+)/NADH kinase [Actinomycetota bacterium]|nr:NAD(+)/NADH kinase [Actinomycetota bacterium]